MKKLVLFVGAVLLILAAVVIFRTARLGRAPAVSVQATADFQVNAAEAAERFAGAIRFPTVSFMDRTQTDSAAFLGLHQYFADTYPNIERVLTRETVSGLSLLYTWEGREPNLEPIVLMGHIDAVPVIPGTEGDWTHGPFEGAIADGYVWGRGTMDDKMTVVSILEAVEHLIGEGFQPRRTIYLAFGHDEEIGGPEGAKVIAELLTERIGGQFAYVLDEGGFITEGFIPSVDGTIALIGIAEKGYVSFELRIDGAGGHSSVPPPHTNVGILAEAITKLEAKPFPRRLGGPVRTMMETIGPRMSFTSRMALANLWLFGPIVTRRMAATPNGAAMVRTTTAATMFDAGVKDNVLPITASAVVNFRILPGETVSSVRERVRQVIDDDRIQISAVSVENEPSPASDPNSSAYRMIEQTIHQVIPGDILVTPYLVFGGTDAKHYSGRSPNVFRFLPISMGEGDLERFHGTNERVAVDNLAFSIRYFYQLIRNSEAI